MDKLFFLIIGCMSTQAIVKIYMLNFFNMNHGIFLLILGFSKDRLLNFLRKYVPNSKLIDEMGSELCYQLVYDKEASFEELFSDLEKHHAEMGISTYGISDTTLEEVSIFCFLYFLEYK